MKKFTKQIISQARKKNDVWDLANEVLYKLCRSHPHHRKHDEIIAKIWMIGRTYAAAIERRKNKKVDKPGDLFYEDSVAPKIKRSHIDQWFKLLRKSPTPENAIHIHWKVTNLFQKISGLEKRSLASKYLHFHFENTFFIYDSRSVAALRMIETEYAPLKSFRGKFDAGYAKFFRRCLWLKQNLHDEYGCDLSPRELDKVLIFLADSNK